MTLSVLTLGEALVALVPADDGSLVTTKSLGLHVGGSELNVAIGLARLGVDVAWMGALGDDPMGRRVLEALRAEGVDTDYVRFAAGQTAVYMRDVIEHGEREVTYYRQGSVASELAPDLWPADPPSASWLHVSGITAALGVDARALLSIAIDWAVAHGVPVSFDPNYRRALWSPETAAPHLRELAARADLTLLSEVDARVMVDSDEPRTVLDRLAELGVDDVVLKRGDASVFASGAEIQGASHSGARPAACDGVQTGGRAPCPHVDGYHEVSPPAVDPVDTVGAGDGFDAGYIAARLAGADVATAVRMGCLIGAHAVQAIGEHSYPTLAELPPDTGATCRPWSPC